MKPIFSAKLKNHAKLKVNFHTVLTQFMVNVITVVLTELAAWGLRSESLNCEVRHTVCCSILHTAVRHTACCSTLHTAVRHTACCSTLQTEVRHTACCSTLHTAVWHTACCSTLQNEVRHTACCSTCNRQPQALTIQLLHLYQTVTTR
jgi:hypothetical protein